ncbi:DUF4221 family protein [Algoriphagus sp. PAP.12]|uniref:DUF4221 family protein n=1 Tax=Algoriphagus sp. PAP.12 TaxID=2996678 RepID=UPI00227AA13C|nr:DUF4221 family protein [Algoriphagus sp. PAP.12]
MRHQILLFFALVFISFSCTKKSENSTPIIDFEELIADTLVLEKDMNLARISPSLTYAQTDSGEFLLDFIKLHLVGFHYPEGNKAFERFYFPEGPDGLGSTSFKNEITPKGIYVIDADSKIHLAGFDSKVIQSWKLPETPEGRLYSNYTVMAGNRISKIGNELLIADVPYVLNENIIDFQDWVLKYNLEDSTWDYISFPYPAFMREFYDDPNLGTYTHFFNPENQESIVSFPVLDSLMIIKDQSISWKDASPKEPLIFKKGKTVPSGEFIAFEPDHDSGRYTWIDYDPYQKIYLRHALSGLKPEGSDPEHPYYEKLILLNKRLEKIAELENLPNSHRGFATPDGYYFYLGFGAVEEEVLYVKLDFSKISR